MAFKRFDPEDFLVSSDSITSTLWSTGAPILTSFETSSIQAAGSSGNYYLSIYQTSSTDPTAQVQFDIAYGDALGSGSTWYNPIVPGNSYTKTIYGQYRSMILEDENASFVFGTGNNSYTGNNFWVLSIERARYKQSLFPGSLNLQISGSGGIINLTDNSLDNPVNVFLGSTRVLQLVSGSNGSGISGGGYVAGSGSYGLVFPDLGTIMLNPAAISQSIQVDASRSNNSDGLNNQTMFNALSGAASKSFISGSTGEIIYSNFINQPQVYITTVGMYNDSNDLLAVAKMSRPLLKDFTKEALVRVKLDF